MVGRQTVSERHAWPRSHGFTSRDLTHLAALLWSTAECGRATPRAQAVWSPSEAHVESSGPRPGGWVGPKRTGGSGGGKQREAEPTALSDRRACVWNSARQLGRSHWESDTVLHVEVLPALRARAKTRARA